MLKYGYERRMASGVVAISGTLAMLLPTSIAMVLYAMLADVSIAKMLIAGLFPAVIVTLTVALTVYALALWRPQDAPLTQKRTLREKITLLRPVGPMLILMAAVTAVIYTGVATPTEASAMGALCASLLYFWRRGMRYEFFSVVTRATRTSCMLGVIILGAHIFTTFFALTQTTQNMIAWVGGLGVSPWAVVAIIVLIILALGCFMDQMAILVLTVPVVAPLLHSMGFDLVWFGVIKIITAEVGLVTPPLGLNCYVVAKYSKVRVGDVFRGVAPHVGTHMIAILILLLFPQISLWLPNHMR
jgi:tripartite ATP-independent transporter DctM subunit